MTNPGISHAVYFQGSSLLPSSSPKERRPERDNIPHEFDSPLIPDRNTFVTKAEVMAQNNVRHVRSGCHHEAPSSKQNITPAKGAPNAAATPAAEPHAMKSLFSLSLRNSLNLDHRVSNPKVDDFPCESPAPHIAPVCIIGPSLPTGKPAPTARATPPAFANRVFIRIDLLIITPFSRLLISGIPDPAATGSNTTKRPPRAAIPPHNPTVMSSAHPGNASPFCSLSIQFW
eukprot:CAMPEP_0184504230 /NCGR_PEP_ID=MMETSP0113_2-20130426/52329_1 /TAXON_ID=91329 /ORGANISM="Norrisiella sphaerica, Strain BC52" /LENGTH=229 /DNA_ID=CAMNT_0026893855 /DNA_START=1818 /DNA_END=2504 /DNA_ORIENTATION=+